ncbi:venom metalloproteinase 2-like [Venturia canescens]|uniref:venom metalloproteinase 2-like n=1 Tax=Venturia canescens TaxID=32260 RepID=UPI001C9C7C5B|nr:venom metalloproteinase 2-like [Venturia canescens]
MSRWQIVVCFCLVSAGHESLQIHEHMTDEEVRSVFHTDRNSIPDYEVVPVSHSVPGEDGNKNLKVFFKAFGDDVILNLDPAGDFLFSENTPIYTVASNSSYPNGLKYELVAGTDLNKRPTIYEDAEKKASLASYEGEDGRIHFNGPYGEKFIIRSIPNRVLKIVNQNVTDEYSKHPQRIHGHGDYIKLANDHVIVKFPLEELTGRSYGNADENLSKQLSEMKDENPGPRAPPEIIYPEILVIIDYESYKSHGSNIWDSVLYYAAFFNGVDLKYRILEQPKVRLNIAGMVISMDHEATPYLNKKRIKEDLVEAAALDELSLYLYQEARFPRNSYDAVVTITHSQLCQCTKNQISDCPAVRGISKYGTACYWDDKTKRMESVALVHDTGFSGIPTAAHELAHVLGVPHDGSASLSYVGGPGAKDCKWEDGYLMSSFRHDQRALTWSICSQECFRYFLNKPQASCLYNQPAEPKETLPRILPGKLLSVDEQCFRAIGGESCWHNENVCTLLWCRVPNTDSDCIASTPAAEGSECGTDKICIRGQCVNASLDHWEP